MAYGTVLADQIQSSVSGVSLGAGNASIMKNRIINGAMVIDQRNAGASVTPSADPTYTLDRWVFQLSQVSKFSVQQNAGSVTPPAGFANYLGITVGASANVTVGATDYFLVQQKIEGYNVADLGFGTANAKTVTLSFWVRSSLTGTFGGSLRNSAENRSYPFSYTISAANTWEQKSITIAGDTSGTWLTTNGIGLEVALSLGVGSTYSGTAGTWAGTNYANATGSVNLITTNSATFYITGVQLEVGSSATGYEYRQYGQELALCQRYYAKIQDPVARGVTTGGAGGGASRLALVFPVTMRVTPTFGFNGTFGFWNGTATRTSTGGFNVFGYGTNQYDFDADLNSAFPAGGDACCMYSQTANPPPWISLSSEL